MATWSLYRNIEASLDDFLIAQALSDSLKDINNNSISFQVGRKQSSSGELPLITMYMDSEVTTRFEIGSFKREDLQTVIIDIYAKTEADRLDLAKWVVDTINNGWTYYIYADSADPDVPTKTASGRINVQTFLTNERVNLGQNTDTYDQHRHRISINVWNSGS